MICNGMADPMMIAAMLKLMMMTMMTATAYHHIMLIDIETQSLANHMAKTILAWTFPHDGMAHQKFLSISKCLHGGRKKHRNNQSTQNTNTLIHHHHENDGDDDDGNHTKETRYNTEIRNPSFSVAKSK